MSEVVKVALVLAAAYVFAGEVLVVLFIVHARRAHVRRWRLHTLPLLFVIGALTWPWWAGRTVYDNQIGAPRG